VSVGVEQQIVNGGGGEGVLLPSLHEGRREGPWNPKLTRHWDPSFHEYGDRLQFSGPKGRRFSTCLFPGLEELAEKVEGPGVGLCFSPKRSRTVPSGGAEHRVLLTFECRELPLLAVG
jgi:hypothetical protein